MITSDFEQQASAGAKLLDEKSPNWYQKINTHTLNLNHQCNCILGQLFGGFLTGFGILNPNQSYNTGHANQLAEHGFILKLEHLSDINSNYEKLRLAWLAEIEKRRGQQNL